MSRQREFRTCAPCREQRKRSYHDEPDSARIYNLRYRYGLEPEDYERMQEEQAHACAACGEPFVVRPDIDHSHETNEVRGLLCHPCNAAVGFCRDDPEVALRVALYLERFAQT